MLSLTESEKIDKIVIEKNTPKTTNIIFLLIGALIFLNHDPDHTHT